MRLQPRCVRLQPICTRVQLECMRLLSDCSLEYCSSNIRFMGTGQGAPPAYQHQHQLTERSACEAPRPAATARGGPRHLWRPCLINMVHGCVVHFCQQSNESSILLPVAMLLLLLEPAAQLGDSPCGGAGAGCTLFAFRSPGRVRRRANGPRLAPRPLLIPAAGKSGGRARKGEHRATLRRASSRSHSWRSRSLSLANAARSSAASATSATSAASSPPLRDSTGVGAWLAAARLAAARLVRVPPLPPSPPISRISPLPPILPLLLTSLTSPISRGGEDGAAPCLRRCRCCSRAASSRVPGWPQ